MSCHSTAGGHCRSSAADGDTPYKLLLAWPEMIPLELRGRQSARDPQEPDATMATVTAAGKRRHDAVSARH